ncbi:MAG: hypothetical protein AB1584_18390 [Pseudomonadota bacterium]
METSYAPEQIEATSANMLSGSMSKTKKTRFFARIDGVECLLFSIQKSANDGLTITSRTPKFFEGAKGPFGTQLEFDHQHYSVHETNEGRDTTITQKTQLIGEHHSIVTLLRETKDYLLWPVFARRYPIFLTEENRLIRKSRDTLIELAEYVYERSNLLFSVFVSRPSFDVSVLKNSGIRFETALFDKHLIIVIPSFIHLPSLPSGDVTGYSSTPVVIDGKKEEDHFQLNVKSVPADKLYTAHQKLMGILQKAYLLRLNTHATEINQNITFPSFLLEVTQNPPNQRSVPDYSYKDSREIMFRS